MTFVVNGSDALTIDNASDFSFPNTAKVEIMETANTGPILAIGTDSNSLSDDAFYGGIDFFAGSSKTVNGRIQGKISGTSENGGHLSFETRLAGGSLTEKMKLFSTGKLFLQTDNIDEIIEVKSTKDGSGTGLIRVIPAANSFTASTRAFVADFINTDHSSAQIGFQLEGSAGVKGSIVSNGNTTASYVTSSDFRLKTDIEDLPDGMSTVKKLRPVKFRWISEGENARYDHGFIAQEAYKVYEKSVFVGGDDPKTEPWQMGNSDLVPIMVKALQESNETIELLTQRCDVLEGTTIEGILLDGTDGSATDAGSKILLG